MERQRREASVGLAGGLCVTVNGNTDNIVTTAGVRLNGMAAWGYSLF